MACPSETEIQDLVEGRLQSEAAGALSVHLEECPTCRALVGAVQPVHTGTAELERVGRYLIRRILGAGGMGVVFEAFDPELGRIVALKVLREDAGSSALQERLVLEARAMAKLSHPNVVAIHDVGRIGNQVFIVMDLVDGESLRHHLARQHRSTAEILDIFQQAGSGLAAAHAAGLVHRDFKPENILCATDGRVLVSDFGLALSGAQETDAATIAQEGSPAYMAPEQRAGTQLDARSDQYSYCLSLSEALGIVVPGSGAPGMRANVPRWLLQIVDRGLSTDPSRRFSSMTELVRALERGQRRRRDRRLAAALLGAAVLLGGATFWAGGQRLRGGAVCREGAAQIEAVWNATRTAQLKRGFAAIESPLSTGSWLRVEGGLGEYATAWRTAQARTCEASRLSGEQSQVVFEQKMSCLSERLHLFRAVTTELERTSSSSLEQIPILLAILPPVAACEDLNELAQAAPLPREDQRASVEAARRAVSTAAAAVSAGRYQEGLALAEAAAGVADTTRYFPVIAEAYLWKGTAYGRLGQVKDAELALERSASSASAGRAVAIAVRAWIQLLHFVGFEGKRHDDGARYNDYAEAALRSLVGGTEQEAERLSWLSAMLLDEKRFDEALEVARRQLALVDVARGKRHPLYLTALDRIAGALSGLGKSADALEPQTRACEGLEAELGSPHPQLALCLNNLAALHARLGRHEAALPMKRRALEMFRQLPGHPRHVAMTRRNLVRSLLELGELGEAERELDTATTEAAPTDEVAILRLRGDLLRQEGQLKEAMAIHTLAVDKTANAEPPTQIDPLVALSTTALAAGRFEDVERLTDRAIHLGEDAYGKDSYRLAEPLRLGADARLARGRAAEAVVLAQRASALLDAAQTDPLDVARARFCLARALASAESTSERTRSLVESARSLIAADRRGKELVARIDGWSPRRR